MQGLLLSHVWKQIVVAKSSESMLRNIMYQKRLKNNNRSPTTEMFAAVNTIMTNQRKIFLTIKDKFQEAECLDVNPRDK